MPLPSSPQGLHPRRQAERRLFAEQTFAHLPLVIDDIGDRQHGTGRQAIARGRVLLEYGEFNPHRLGRLSQIRALQTVEVHPHDAHRLRLELRGEGIQLGNFATTGRTPLGPVINHQPLAFQTLSRYLSSMLIDADIFSATSQNQAGADSRYRTNHDLESRSHAFAPRPHWVDMTLDALRLEVPDILEEDAAPLADLNERLAQARSLQHEDALQQVLSLLFRLNRSAMTLLERQRALQNCSDEYRHYAAAYLDGKHPSPLFVRLCNELAIGFKRLLLQILKGRHPSRPHLAWCLYMALHFLAQSLLRHYQLYREPPPSLWRDSHLLYWIGEHQNCLDEPVAAAFTPQPANTMRGIYQQMLLLALSNPFHLADGECALLFGALSPLAGLARLLPWDEDDEIEGPTIDLTEAQPCLSYAQTPEGSADCLRRFELGALLVALHDPAPLQSQAERQLLERVQQHWLGRQQRRHTRADHSSECNLMVGLPAIHAQLLEQRPLRTSAQMLDASAGGARLLCNADQAAQLPVGQLVLLITGNDTPTLALRSEE